MLEPEEFITEDALVSTSCLGDALQQDVVGNAAALDVYKFLRVECQGGTLLDLVRAGDSALAAALSDDPDLAESIMHGLACIAGSGKAPASHTLTRQVYFPLDEGEYHLLAPLFPSSLVHAVHSHLREDRFSDEIKAARKARRDETGYPEYQDGYREYPGFAVMAYGGSKPQNVSQLNTERYGENWLLPSFPPTWQTRRLRPPLNITSAITYVYGRKRQVKDLVKGLSAFLVKVQNYNNKNIRQAREGMVSWLCDLLIQFSYDMHRLEPGWSLDEQCRLHPNEVLWLDPGRGDDDPEFAKQREGGEWRDYVAHDFGIWLNRQFNYHAKRLKKSRIALQFGDDEHHEWKKVSGQALKELREELNHV